MIVSLVSASKAQSHGFSAADSKELASYRLTMETTKKVHALMRSIMQDMAGDPKFQALQKTKAEIEALSKKEELTDAESERLEKLQMLAEEQEHALEQTTDGMDMNTAQNLSDMEAAIKSNPRFMAALKKAGLTPREYSKYMLTSLMAGMVAGFQKSGMLEWPVILSGPETALIHPNFIPSDPSLVMKPAPPGRKTTIPSGHSPNTESSPLP